MTLPKEETETLMWDNLTIVKGQKKTTLPKPILPDLSFSFTENLNIELKYVFSFFCILCICSPWEFTEHLSIRYNVSYLCMRKPVFRTHWDLASIRVIPHAFREHLYLIWCLDIKYRA